LNLVPVLLIQHLFSSWAMIAHVFDVYYVIHNFDV
jgi:hypothetical protein